MGHNISNTNSQMKDYIQAKYLLEIIHMVVPIKEKSGLSNVNVQTQHIVNQYYQ